MRAAGVTLNRYSMNDAIIRKPVVAGAFYPASAVDLKKQIGSLIDADVKKINAISCMLPHAGYMYSGEVAAKTLSAINLKQKIILLGPNHTGLGKPYSIMTRGVWQTPLGDVKIDSFLANQILEGSSYLKDDLGAHMEEHSLEVELPLLQYFGGKFEIVPIVLASDNLIALKDVGRSVAESINSLGLNNSTLIVASSDMTHYEPQEDAQLKDKEAISAILELNEDKLSERVHRLGISMCGFAPVVAMLAAAKLLGAKKGLQVKYQTSGDITGDKTSVVGYCGIIIN